MQYLRLRLLIGCRMLLTLTSYCHVISTISGKEYCLNQSFEARCGPQEIVMVHQASYGRMRLGTCVQKDYGSMGCQADVTEVLSGACSGKESCSIVNMEAFFSSFNRCPSDLKSYLDANVTCLAVQRHPCSSDGLIYLAAQTIGSGNVISGSVVMAMPGADAEFMECPFVIEGKPGQRINITLSDFFELPISSDPNNNQQQQHQHNQQQHQHIQQQQTHLHKEGKNVLKEKYSGDEEHAEHLCKKYATIWDGSEVKNLVMCRRNAGVFGRLESVYVSSSNKIRLRVEVGINQRFIVTYNVIGCPFPDLPHDAHIVSPSGRESRWSMPKITIRCNQSEDSLLLTCNNGIYVSDNQATLNCTRKLPQGLPEDWSSSSEMKSFFPYGISMLLVAVVATCICLITLAIGLLYVNRKDRRMQNARKLTSLMNGGSVPFDMIAIPGAYDHLSTDPNLGKGTMYPNAKKGAHFEYPHNRRGECHYSPVTNRNWSGVHGTLTPSSPERRLLIPLTCPETSTIKVTSPIMSATPHFRGNLPLPHLPMDAPQDGGMILSEVCSDPSSCMRTTELTTPPTIRCSCTMPKQINKSRLDVLPGVIKKLNTERKTRKPFSSSSFDSGPQKRNTFFAPSNTTKSGINSNKPHLNPEQHPHPGSNFFSSPSTATTASGSVSPPTFSTFKPVDVVESCVSGQNRSSNNNNNNGDKFSQQFCSNDQLTRPVGSQNESQWRESSSSSSSSAKNPFQAPVDAIRNSCNALTQRQCSTPKSGRATGVRFTMTANDRQDDQQHRAYKMAEHGSALV